MTVTSEQVAAYRALVESLARRWVGLNQAEFDDLVQEGLIFVWLSLRAGARVSAEHIENRMKNWVRYLGRQVPVDYEDLMPFTESLPAELYEETGTLLAG